MELGETAAVPVAVPRNGAVPVRNWVGARSQLGRLRVHLRAAHRGLSRGATRLERAASVVLERSSGRQGLDLAQGTELHEFVDSG